MEDTFTQLPLHLDPSTKAISCSSVDSQSLAEELATLNATHRALLSLESSHSVPPPPLPLNPKRSAAIDRMRQQGNASMSKRRAIAPKREDKEGHDGPPPNPHVQEAIKLYSYAIDMALGRPPWEPVHIVRDELALLMSNRAQAYMAMQAWPEGAVDSETSVDMKASGGQSKAWWRRARCLKEMGRYAEAEEVVARALEVEPGAGTGEGGDGADLRSLKAEIDNKIKTQRDRESRR